MTISENQGLTACVVCRDERGKGFAGLLLAHFSEVYVISGESDKWKCDPKNFEGDCIPTKKLPEHVSAAFFHSSDESLWGSNHITADCIFEFNTPGTPKPKTETILPILKRTGPSFDISAADITEVADFLRGQRQALPSMCCPPIETLPALAMLCQGYLATGAAAKPVTDSWQQAEVNSALEAIGWPDFGQDFTHFSEASISGRSAETVQKPSWWLTTFGSVQALRQTAQREWQQLGNQQDFATELEQLIDAIALGTSIDSPQLVAQAYSVIAPYLAANN